MRRPRKTSMLSLVRRIKSEDDALQVVISAAKFYVTIGIILILLSLISWNGLWLLIYGLVIVGLAIVFEGCSSTLVAIILFVMSVVVIIVFYDTPSLRDACLVVLSVPVLLVSIRAIQATLTLRGRNR